MESKGLKDVIKGENLALIWLHDFILPVPDDFRVDPEFLGEMENKDFIQGLKSLTETVKKIYADMLENPSEYGLKVPDELIADINEYIRTNELSQEEYDSLRGDKMGAKAYNIMKHSVAVRNSANRLIMIFEVFAKNGVLSDGKIMLEKKAFTDASKNRTPINKISGADKLLKKIEEFEFMYDGSALSHKDKNIIPVLYSYLKNVCDYTLNYQYAVHKDDITEDSYPIFFSEYLDGKEKDFFLKFHDFMKKAGLAKEGERSSFGAGFDYGDDAKMKRFIARFEFWDSNLSVRIKLCFIAEYSNLIETFPENVKKMFRFRSPEEVKEGKVIRCGNCKEVCVARSHRIFEGIEYIECGQHGLDYNIEIFEPDDAGYYVRMIQAELEERNKPRKKAK
jgi:hypothetical protein